MSTLTLMGAGPETAGAGPFTPASISGLTTWLKADAGTSTTTNGAGISQWSDQSGSTNHATQATGGLQPTYVTTGINSLPSVGFASASSQRFTMPTLAALTAGTGFIVIKINTDPPGAPVATGLWGLGTDASLDSCYPWTDGIIYDTFGSTARKTTVNPVPALTAAHNYCVVSAAGAWTNYLDGSQLFTTATNTVGFPATPALGTGINGGTFIDGQVGEFILYNSALSTGNRQSVETYLRTKWGTP